MTAQLVSPRAPGPPSESLQGRNPREVGAVLSRVPWELAVTLTDTEAAGAAPVRVLGVDATIGNVR